MNSFCPKRPTNTLGSPKCSYTIIFYMIFRSNDCDKQMNFNCQKLAELIVIHDSVKIH